GQGDEGRALPAGCHVPTPEFAHGRDAGAFGDNRGHAKAEGRGESTIRLVPDRVAWTAHALNSLQTQAGPIRNLADGSCKSFSQQAVQQADLPCLARSRTRCPKDKLLQIAPEGLVECIHQPDLKVESDPV